MLSKNNFKYILVLALGFFACSYIYLIESIILKIYSNTDFANTVSVLYASFAMAIGILLFSIMYKKSKNIKKYYILFMLFSMISLIIFFTTKNVMVMSTCLCLSCLFGTAGFGASYHFSLISSNVEECYQARVYAIGYAIGSLLTYIFSIFSIFKSIYFLAIIIPTIVINIYMVCKCKSLIEIKKEDYTLSFKKIFITLSVIVISMSALSAISQVLIGFYTFNVSNNWFADTRIHYSLGLIIAGIIYDKRKDIFDIFLPISFIYPLISIVLLNQNISVTIISGVSYFFLGFFSVFRTLAFMNLGLKKKNMLIFSGFGLMYERIMEGITAIFQRKLLNNYLILISICAILLGIVLWIYLIFYLKSNKDDIDKVKELALKNGLSGQEEKVLNLMVQDLTNKEMADKLFLSVNTVRNHVANIYKKTNMNKKELKEKCFFGTKM